MVALAAVRADKDTVLNWLADRDLCVAFKRYLSRTACVLGSLKAAKTLEKLFSSNELPHTRDHIYDAAYAGHLEIVKWLYDKILDTGEDFDFSGVLHSSMRCPNVEV